jgi:hypothetical protein
MRSLRPRATDFTNVCPLPWLAHNYTIFPYWDDLRTDNLGWAGCAAYPNGQCGIFTSVTGSSPESYLQHRMARRLLRQHRGHANHELRLYEAQTHFDVIYGTVDLGNSSATAGVQKNDTAFDQYFCNGSGGAATGGQSYILQSCGTPTPTPHAYSHANCDTDTHSYADCNAYSHANCDTDTHSYADCNAYTYARADHAARAWLQSARSPNGGPLLEWGHLG